MRVIGMDIHRVFAEAVALLDGKTTRLGRVDMRRDRLEEFARTALTHDDHVVVEATGNAAAVAEVLAPHVGRVVIANPKQVRLIAHAKIKTDGIDAAVLAKLYASGFLPEVWVPDERTGALRRQVSRRTQLVRQRTRIKNIVQSILHAHLVPPCPHADLFGARGRAWLAAQALPEDERLAVERHVRTLDGMLADLRAVERDIARHALDDGAVRRLMTIPGIDMVVGVGLAAAIGDVARFASAEKLVAYLGLNPSVRQSGEGPARHGRIAKQGRGHARGMLVEAAWAAARSPGPFRAFFRRISARRGQHVAAVATARKLAVLAWRLLTRGEDYAWARPALQARKQRSLELRAGQPPRRAQRGAAYDYNIKGIRERERRPAEGAEAAYRRLTDRWIQAGPRRRARTGAAKEERPS
ncbi:MAG: Mobile element protein [uncultured Acetobacteraceae bacterium]|uniref:Mobile element protein n=1 Tax=uncultured Acetobacteraceae bacterium TaxID=169975 RepID=A0A6J4H6D6_9PROT|nr:MAG: Mobile element protein [uncultured Acetobacteraceae bacterium]